jgi:RimJ/RimL family protein N-acetyltransferase
LLEGKTVNLRVMERDDVDFMAECRNDTDFWGEYAPVGEQISKSEWLRHFDNPSTDLTGWKTFIVQKKDGTKIGIVNHHLNLPCKWVEIAYFLAPNKRKKGYGTEAVQLLVDYLFLSKDVARIHAFVDVRNKVSQRVLEKAGFQREGTMRKCVFNRGQLRDYHLYSILREEWKEPKILPRSSKTNDKPTLLFCKEISS